MKYVILEAGIDVVPNHKMRDANTTGKGYMGSHRAGLFHTHAVKNVRGKPYIVAGPFYSYSTAVRKMRALIHERDMEPMGRYGELDISILTPELQKELESRPGTIAWKDQPKKRKKFTSPKPRVKGSKKRTKE